MKINKLEIDFGIPDYLEKDINALCESIERGELYDCEESEVYGSINMAMTSGEISIMQADILRDYYLNGGIWNNE
jgi:hypothetical protein